MSLAGWALVDLAPVVIEGRVELGRRELLQGHYCSSWKVTAIVVLWPWVENLRALHAVDLVDGPVGIERQVTPGLGWSEERGPHQLWRGHEYVPAAEEAPA